MKRIEMRNVSFSYEGGKKILDHVSFGLDAGEFALLSGDSGSGKSTILSLLSGIIPNVTEGHLEGEILLDGKNIAGMRIASLCREVGVVLQNADAQIINKRVDDEIAFGMENLGFSEEKMERQLSIVLSLMDLKGEDFSRTLSGGQKQRLIVASTLAMGQRILLLDEPLANLDKEGAEELLGTLKALAAKGYTILLIEHRVDFCLPYVDTVYSLKKGVLTKVEDKETYLRDKSEILPPYAPSEEDRGPLFEVQHLSYRVKEKEILHDLSFVIPKGKKTLILGENGTGKTTLLRLLSRLSKASDGTIRQFLDSSFGQKGRAGKRWFKKVGVIYQNPDYQLFMSRVYDEIDFASSSKEETEKLLSLFRLEEYRDRHPASLSEGQKRKLSIAAVLASRPEVLLLDEPTVGQDFESLRELCAILERYHEETGNTMITITHDKRCALPLADHALLLREGRTIEVGGQDLVKRYFGL